MAQACWSPTSHEIDSSDGADFIVMELPDGAPLDGLIPKGGLPLLWVWLRANCFRASAPLSLARVDGRPRVINQYIPPVLRSLWFRVAVTENLKAAGQAVLAIRANTTKILRPVTTTAIGRQAFPDK